MHRTLRATAGAAVAAAALVLAACIPSGGGGEAAGEADNKITWFYPGGEQPLSEEIWTSQVAAFQEEHPDIEVEVLPVPWDLAHDRLVNMVRAGDPPDVIQLGSRWIPEFVEMGALRTLDEHFGADKREIFYPSVIGTTEFQGKLYALPRQASTKALFYRTDLIDTPPRTWDQLVTTGTRLQRENPGMKGFGLAGATHVSTSSQFLTILSTFGGRVYDDQGRVVLDSPETVAALELVRDLNREHEVLPNPLQYNREQFGDLFKAEQVAMFVSGPWGGPTINEDPDNDRTPYAVAPVPEGPAGTATIIVTDSTGISAETPDVEAAVTFLDWVTSEEVLLEMSLTQGRVLPIGPGIAAEPEIEQDEYLQTFIEMADHGVPQPQPLLWEPFQDIIVEMVQSVMVGEASPQEAARDAAQRIRDEELEPIAG